MIFIDFRLNDEIKFLSKHFDVALYAYPKLARNHMAILLNMDLQRTFIKKSRSLLKLVMEHSDINCLFYKLYLDPIIMEEVCKKNNVTRFIRYTKRYFSVNFLTLLN